MPISLRSTLSLVLSLAVLSGSILSADERPAAPAAIPHKVALIDVAFVFKEYDKFKLFQEDLKAEVEQAQEQDRKLLEDMKAEQAKMKSYQEGTPEFAQSEKKLAQLNLERQTFQLNQQRDFAKKQAQMYHTIYLEVSDYVAKYAKHKSYTLVLKFSRDEVEADNPNALLQGLNRPVVYFRAEDDITDTILTAMNDRFKGGASRSAAPASASKPKASATK